MTDAQAIIQQLTNHDVKTSGGVSKVIEATLKILGDVKITYVPTGSNPANLLTKRISRINNKLPRFFQSQLLDLCYVNRVKEPQLFDRMWHFTFTKTRKMIAWWLRFVNRARNATNRVQTREIVPLNKTELV